MKNQRKTKKNFYGRHRGDSKKNQNGSDCIEEDCKRQEKLEEMYGGSLNVVRHEGAWMQKEEVVVVLECWVCTLPGNTVSGREHRGQELQENNC